MGKHVPLKTSETTTDPGDLEKVGEVPPADAGSPGPTPVVAPAPPPGDASSDAGPDGPAGAPPRDDLLASDLEDAELTPGELLDFLRSQGEPKAPDEPVLEDGKPAPVVGVGVDPEVVDEPPPSFDEQEPPEPTPDVVGTAVFSDPDELGPQVPEESQQHKLLSGSVLPDPAKAGPLPRVEGTTAEVDEPDDIARMASEPVFGVNTGDDCRGRATIGYSQHGATAVKVIFLRDEWKRMLSSAPGGKKRPAAGVVRYHVSSVVGRKHQPYNLNPSDRAVQKVPNSAGRVMVHVRIADGALQVIRGLERGKYGCDTNARLVRWACLRGLGYRPKEIRRRLEAFGPGRPRNRSSA